MMGNEDNSAIRVPLLGRITVHAGIATRVGAGFHFRLLSPLTRLFRPRAMLSATPRTPIGYARTHGVSRQGTSR